MNKDEEVYVVVKPTADGFEHFGIFSLPELAQPEADSHPGAFVVPIPLDVPTSF